MVFQSRNKQVLIAAELTPGVAIALDQSHLILPVINAAYTPTYGRVANDVSTPSFSEKADRPGLNTGRLTFGFEMGGPVDGLLTTAPPFHSLLRSSNFRGEALKKITIGTFSSGTVLKQGQIFTTSPGNMQGLIFQSLYKNELGRTTLRYLPIGAAITGAQTSLTVNSEDNAYDATVTLSSPSPTDAGYGYIPHTRQLAKVTIGAIAGGSGTAGVGEVIFGNTSKAVGIVARNVAGAGDLFYIPVLGAFASAEVLALGTDGDLTTTSSVPVIGEVPTLSAAIIEDGRMRVLRGALVTQLQITAISGQRPIATVQIDGIQSTPQDRLTYASLIGTQQPGARFVSADLQIVEQEAAGAQFWGYRNLNQLQVTIAAGAEPREDAGDSMGALQYLHGARRVTWGIDPEAINETAFPLTNKAQEQILFRIRAGWGTAGTHNAYELSSDLLQVDSEQTADRGGKLVNQLQLRATGEIDDEFSMVMK